MTVQQHQEFYELLGWQEDYGVLSVCLAVEPADRGEKWRIQLKNCLAELLKQQQEDGGEKQKLRALQHSSAYAFDHLSRKDVFTHGLTHLGFVASDGKKIVREYWRELQLPAAETEAHFQARPYLRPLLDLEAELAPRGVLGVSGDQVRLLQWLDGGLQELENYRITLSTPDWRERKAPGSLDGGSAHGVSSAGRDQYQQRVQANRQHFLKEVGATIESLGRKNNWQELLSFGEPDYSQELQQGFHNGLVITSFDEHNILHEPPGHLLERVHQSIKEVISQREQATLDGLLSSEGVPSKKVVLGPSKVMSALSKGRAAEVLIDLENGLGEQRLEQMIEQALLTGAEVMLLHSHQQRLQASQGVVAHLRY